MLRIYSNEIYKEGAHLPIKVGGRLLLYLYFLELEWGVIVEKNYVSYVIHIKQDMSDHFKGWKQKKPVENTKQNRQKTVNHVKI